ncbi:MAG: dihydropteroate synthase [Myxococcota bacterium]|jgi:dihydropteroate synthase|nr:dihydropteroate synthase [Deltaproteobacteria bacterium]MCP4239507.1 dihydropteroate synthase [bacterium]MDP6073649.1 dihydropteroate synthase [Myxococcota bacterium]MDP6242040.1 dihydropteroate synthase [Myxococcota bacterium]MDP7074177.1 dihydropteroate synthase [Myxococcota bacterium]
METIFPRDRVTIVAVLNATPDSFSDGGRFVTQGGQLRLDEAIDAAAGLIDAGAHVLDVGGESTRPGAREVPARVERDRVVPVVEALSKRFAAPVCVDTRKLPVAAAALDAGASIVNDVSGLAHDPGLAGLAAQRGVSLVLGHLRGTPETMQDAPTFADVLAEVAGELEESAGKARAAGVPDAQICVDPGIGFGKNLEQNLKLLAGAGELRRRIGLPVLVGPSRKSFLGALTGDPVHERDAATDAACAVAAFVGADAVRVHAVAGARRAVAVGRALRGATS